MDEMLDGEGVFGLDPTLIVDAVLHYADTSPIEVADALSGFLTEHSEISSDFNDLTPSDAIDDASGFPGEGVGAGFAAFGLDATFDEDVDLDEAGEDIDDTVDDASADFATDTELTDDLDVDFDEDDIDDEPASVFRSSFEDQEDSDIAEEPADIDDFDIDF